MFIDACEHIAKITRVLSQANGHCLLLGVGGSGKQSLSKISSYISGHQVFKIELAKGYNY